MQRTYTARDYSRAEQMLKHRRDALVVGSIDRLVWPDKSDSFWCAVSGPEGVEYLVVDPVAGTRQRAFDHDRLAAGLAEAADTPVDRASLRLSELELEDGAVVVAFEGRRWRCPFEDYVCSPVEPSPVGPGESRSPDGCWTVFVT